MKTKTYKIKDLETVVIGLGYVGENERTRVVIDAGEVFAEYPQATVGIAVLPPEGGRFPVTVTRDGDLVEWVIKNSVLVHDGEGRFQLTFMNGNEVARSCRGKFRVKESIPDGGTAPDAIQDWIDDANEVLEEAREAVEAGVHPPKIGSTGYWEIWDAAEEQYVSSGVKAQGEQGPAGADGHDGAAGHTPVMAGSKEGKTSTITADGVTIATIQDGADADPTQLIDDTAGAGDTDKVLSADKVTGELAQVKTDITKMTTATASDVGKALSPKTVVDGEVTEWKFVSGGGGGSVDVDDTLTQSGEAADAKVTGDLIFGLTEDVQSKNLYNKTACNPQNGKWYNLTDGSVEDSANYAITGKIPVEANTQYIFHNNSLAKVKRVHYFKGDNGETYISKETLDNAAFTTPALCTYIGITLFAVSHTSEAYTAAMAVAMLEKGGVASDYVPYSVTKKVKTDRLVDGVAVQGAKNYTVEKSLINLFDKTKAQDGTVFNQITSEVIASADYGFSGLIPVEPNTQYCYSIDETLQKGKLPSKYQEWDVNKGFIRQTQGDQSNIFINQIQTGSTTKFISFNLLFDSHTVTEFNNMIDTIMIVEGTQRPLSYVAYNNEPVVNHQKFDTGYHDNADRFTGKRWLAFGTSVTYQDSKQYTEGVAEGEIVRGYIGDVARRKQMLVTNSGISGSTLGNYSSDSLINRYSNFTYTNYDFVTIEYGINDFGHDIPVGTSADAAGNSTFAACLKTIIEYILTANPIIGLIICTDPDVRGTTTNNNSNTLKDYADVTLEIAKQYRLPVCDWFYGSGINAITKGNGTSRYALTQSGTHPSVYGHMRMGAMLNQVFDSLLC